MLGARTVGSAPKEAVSSLVETCRDTSLKAR